MNTDEWPSPAANSGHNVDTSLSSVVPASPWARIKEHKVLQWSLAYLGAALALAHGQELLAHNFHWPELVGHILIGTLIVGFPIAVALAWYHGHRASRHVSGAEATIIAILLLIGAGLLWALVQPRVATVSAKAIGSSSPATASVSASVSQHSASSDLTTPPRRPRLAILPFENLSPDPANAFFADGLHEEILATLTQRAPGLEVISRTTMILYRAAPKPVETIARELGATHVIEGSVRRAGQRVRLTLQLIDARTDVHLWAQDFDRTLVDTLALQTEVAQAVATQLAVKLGGTTESAPAVDPEAYDLYLKARLARRNLGAANADISAEIHRVTELLERAVGRDPQFGQAHLELANHLVRGFTYFSDEHWLTGARDHLAAAQALIPGDPGLVITQAMYNYAMDIGQPLTPAVEAALANTQDPLNSQVATRLYGQAGRFEETHALYERLAQLDPGNFFLFVEYISNFADVRRPQDALRALDSSVLPRLPAFDVFRKMSRTCIPYEFTGKGDFSVCGSLEDAYYDASYGPSPIRRARNLIFRRRYAEARALIEKSALTGSTAEPGSMTGPVPIAEDLGWIALLMSDKAAAHSQSEAIRAFLTSTPKTHVQAWYGTVLAAEAQLLAGDHAAAIATAQQLIASRPRAKDAWTWYWVAQYSARILAWAGAQDDAVALLDNLSTVQNGLPPALVTRQPLFDVPLAANPRWQALKARLEAQMAATRLE
jgi:TolB-like protein